MNAANNLISVWLPPFVLAHDYLSTGVRNYCNIFPSLVRSGCAKRRGGVEREPDRAKHQELFKDAKPPYDAREALLINRYCSTLNSF
jgi:hypothetical protein